MAKNNQAKKESKKESRDTKAEALKLAEGYAPAGQTKENTKLIAKGVQRGIEQYLRQHSEKSRNLDKRAKQLKKNLDSLSAQAAEETVVEPAQKSAVLPWCLLLISWILFAGYEILLKL